MKEYVKLFEEFITEAKKLKDYDILRDFLEGPLRDEKRGTGFIFTNNTLNKGLLTGQINAKGLHSKRSRGEVEQELKDDKVIVDEKLALLKQAVAEFNMNSEREIEYTVTMNSPSIKTNKWQGATYYECDSLIASIRMNVKK